MKGRNVIPRVQAPENPEPRVDAILEVDKLFWLDPKNKGMMFYLRRHVPGEEFPYKLVDDYNRVMVEVRRWGRTFLVDGIPQLQIVDADLKKKERKEEHTIISMAGLQKKDRKPHDPPPALTAEQRATRRKEEHDRQARRRSKKAATRATVQAKKRKDAVMRFPLGDG